jgi:hypothetical protein
MVGPKPSIPLKNQLCLTLSVKSSHGAITAHITQVFGLTLKFRKEFVPKRTLFERGKLDQFILLMRIISAPRGLTHEGTLFGLASETRIA